MNPTEAELREQLLQKTRELEAAQKAVQSLQEDLESANEEEHDPDLRYLDYEQRARVQALRVGRGLVQTRTTMGMSSSLPGNDAIDGMITLADYIVGNFAEVELDVAESTDQPALLDVEDPFDSL